MLLSMGLPSLDSICGNNLAQAWHFSVEIFKRFLAATQRWTRVCGPGAFINHLFISLSA